MPVTSPKILCVAFSPIHADSRVLRQISVLAEHGEVTTVGYGPKTAGVTRHIEVPENAPSLPQTPRGVTRLLLRQHAAVELHSPAEEAVREETLAAGPYDLVVANDARALPLAFVAASNAPVLADMHEWAPEERATVLSWRLLVGPYMEYLCRTYLPKTAAVSSVSRGLAGLYAERYGVQTSVIRNATELRKLTPSPVNGDRIRLVHSGTADPERNIIELIEATEKLGDRFSLDLYLLEVPGGHLAAIRKKASHSPRVTIHDPVPPKDLPEVLNGYDLGVFLYPLRTLSHLYHLPNKFFDFVQARLGLIFSPAPEIDAHINEYGLGVITADTSANALVDALKGISTEDVVRFKLAADRASRDLSDQVDQQIQHELVSKLLAKT